MRVFCVLPFCPRHFSFLFFVGNSISCYTNQWNCTKAIFLISRKERLKWKEWSKNSVALKFIWPSAGGLPAQKKKDLFPKLADSICPPWTDAHLSDNHHFHFLSTYKCSLVNLALRKKILNARPFWIEIKGIISNLCFAIYVCTCTRQIISCG